jgi:hypothetical protein
MSTGCNATKIRVAGDMPNIIGRAEARIHLAAAMLPGI